MKKSGCDKRQLLQIKHVFSAVLLNLGLRQKLKLTLVYTACNFKSVCTCVPSNQS